MRVYLLETFRYNHQANLAMIERIARLSDRVESIRLMSHLINSQNKWMARITHQPNAHQLSWWEPIFPFDELAERWRESYARWTRFISETAEEDFFKPIWFVGQDGTPWTSLLKDVPLQLNYHSIHHRAQIQMLIRSQGQDPDFIDYIGTVFRKLDQREIETLVNQI